MLYDSVCISDAKLNAAFMAVSLPLIALMILSWIMVALDRAKYAAIYRADAAERARLERDNDEYAAAFRPGDWE